MKRTKPKMKTESSECTLCYGSGKYEDGDCLAGCCPPFRLKDCYRCNGKGVIVKKYKLVKKWVEVNE